MHLQCEWNFNHFVSYWYRRCFGKLLRIWSMGIHQHWLNFYLIIFEFGRFCNFAFTMYEWVWKFLVFWRPTSPDDICVTFNFCDVSLSLCYRIEMKMAHKTFCKLTSGKWILTIHMNKISEMIFYIAVYISVYR